MSVLATLDLPLPEVTRGHSDTSCTSMLPPDKLSPGASARSPHEADQRFSLKAKSHRYGLNEALLATAVCTKLMLVREPHHELQSSLTSCTLPRLLWGHTRTPTSNSLQLLACSSQAGSYSPSSKHTCDTTSCLTAGRSTPPQPDDKRQAHQWHTTGQLPIPPDTLQATPCHSA
jgi:hypothetical protein